MDERCLVYDEEESPRICDIPLDNSKQSFRIVRISIAQMIAQCDCGTFH